MRFSDQPPSYQHLKTVHGKTTPDESLQENVWVDCGWGRVLMGHTFQQPEDIASELLKESAGMRDIAMYVADPHVVLAAAPQTLFLDPSDTYRLDLEDTLVDASQVHGIVVKQVSTLQEAHGVNELYLKRQMVPTDPEFVWAQRTSDQLIWLVALDEKTDTVLGTVMGINHRTLFNDPTQGCSLWCLAVDPQASHPGVGELLLRYLADHFLACGCRYMDLSVLHDNEQAKMLYKKIGFRQIHTFAIKNKNAYNQMLFLGPELEENLNPYARIIVDEARSRGISVDILDAEEGYFRLSRGGTQIDCRESLSELTSAVAMSRCQDKLVTHRWLQRAGLCTPSYRVAGNADENVAFLEEHKRIVVKPAIGEQGMGITVGVETPAALEQALVEAGQHCDRVLLESYHPGQDLRIVVIGYKVVAAAIRKPPEVVGDGSHSIEELIEKLSRRRSASSGGESRIPLDNDTRSCLSEQGLLPGTVLESGRVVRVRRAANFHTGGTIHDVTAELHPALVKAAEQAARYLHIPVVGMDLIVATPDSADYVIIEANERVGLANHEPQPTVQRFIDLLFPLSTSVYDTRESGVKGRA
tara:strand:- start:13706 stop:15460 length:1755 start_codon:yes stop_codon:yes gene_type:complete